MIGAGKLDGGDDVGDSGTARDQRGMAVDHRIVDGASCVVAGIAGNKERAAALYQPALDALLAARQYGQATSLASTALNDDEANMEFVGPKLRDEVRRLVAAGKAATVSGFVQHAVGVALHDAAGWRDMLDGALQQTGGPLTAKERAWAYPDKVPPPLPAWSQWLNSGPDKRGHLDLFVPEPLRARP